MLLNNKITQKLFICILMFMIAQTTVKGQDVQPTWWFGVSGATNFNFYDGTTQRLNNSLIVPTAFHKGKGVRAYGSALVEYRPGRIWGAMLNLAYDGRGGKYDNVIAPCNCPATLKTNTSYFSVEPSLRFGFKSSNLYFFAGPRVAFNMQKDFNYTQLKRPNTDSELSEMQKTLISGQVGVGYEIPISSPSSSTQFRLSPFVSFHPYFGQQPRNIESWDVTTLRTGIALKFGKGSKAAPKDIPAAAVPVPEVVFAVTAPKAIPAKRQVSETLPLLNYVFFDTGSTAIPARYTLLTKDQAAGFKESQLQNESSADTAGRSARQLNIYHNVMNIMGDRMRSNPGAAITLSGASANGPQEGEILAASVKAYMVTSFGIDASRITLKGRTKPLIPSEQPGAKRELTLLREGDRRVDIESTSPELLMEVGGGMMRPVQFNATQADPLDSHLIFNVAGARTLLRSWSVDITDDRGNVQHYGPFTRERESVAGRSVLAGQQERNYKISMTAETKDGLPVKKETSVHLARQVETTQNGFRYSILFGFDKSKTIASYEKFLTNVVSPLIADGSTVIIHGHTDIIGEEEYNQKLSDSRAQEAQKIIERALAGTGKSNVKFETFGFGEDVNHSPFENSLPEERFYNRTVIIDIIVVK
jgi:outer membrane protein OmpA-like peptidoglycan-associated protein